VPAPPDDVRALILAHVETPVAPEDLTDDLPLGEGGVGLDSIAVVELLLEGEERWGVPVLDLIEGPPLRIGDVVEHFARP
jgi:acyl carrier protein